MRNRDQNSYSGWRAWDVVGAGGFAIWMCLFFSPAMAEQIFNRGVSMHGPMNWAMLTKNSSGEYAFPPFADRQHQLPDRALREIRLAGFNFIRLTLDPGPFLQFESDKRDELDRVLASRVNEIIRSGLAVIVDFHPNTQLPEYAPPALVKDENAPIFQKYCETMRQTASLLMSLRTDRVALELMNEPQIAGQYPGTDSQWNREVRSLYACARQGGSQLKIIISGGRIGNIEGLEQLDVTPFQNDSNVIYTFHYYEPWFFTLQSVVRNPTQNLFADVPYPASAHSIQDSVSASLKRLTAQGVSLSNLTKNMAYVSQVLKRYRASGFDDVAIRTEFDRVQKWAVKHHIRSDHILLGEFGVMRTYRRHVGAREAERLHWLKTVRIEAENHGYIWSIWAYHDDAGMGITKTDDSDEIDCATLQALNLNYLACQ